MRYNTHPRTHPKDETGSFSSFSTTHPPTHPPTHLIGADDEPLRYLYECAVWVQGGEWKDVTDSFDYAAAVNDTGKLPVYVRNPPTHLLTYLLTCLAVSSSFLFLLSPNHLPTHPPTHHSRPPSPSPDKATTSWAIP